MMGADGPARVRDVQARRRRLPGQPVVAARDTQVERAREFADGRPEDPGVLAAREIEQTQGAVPPHVPAREAEDAAGEVAAAQSGQGVVEEDVGVGDDHLPAGELAVRVIEEVPERHAAPGRHQPHLRRGQDRVGREEGAGVDGVFDEDVHLGDAGVVDVTAEALEQLALPRRARVEVEARQEDGRGGARRVPRLHTP
jgi:hypothetical protein